MIAAGGDIDMQALSNGIKLLAKLEITQQANRITLSAKDEIVINGGGSYVKLNSSAIEIGTKGPLTAHASMHSLTSPKTIEISNSPLIRPGSSEINGEDYEQFLAFEDKEGNPIDWLEYRVDSGGTKISEGNLDGSGRTPTFDLNKEITGTFWIKRDPNAGPN